MKRHKPLPQIIEEMRSLAQQLEPHSFPQVGRMEARIVDILKQRTVFIDGYQLIAYFSSMNYDDFRIERLELLGLHQPFLPMYLVCRVAAQFLGGHELRYSETFKMGRKVYVWTVGIDDRGRPLPFNDPDMEKCTYEHFDYSFVTSAEPR